MTTSTAAAFWGCGETQLLDVWNCARTLEYVRKYMPQSYNSLKSCCPDFSAVTTPVGASAYNASLPTYLSQAYDNPVADGAWWVDPARPESAAFFGFHVTSLTGRFGDTMDVDVRQGPGCGGSNIYQSTNKPQILTIEATAYGASCCSIAYGVRALRRLLAECGCSAGLDACRGTQMTLHDCNSSGALDDICIPPGDSFVIPADVINPWRLLKNAKLIDMPQIVESRGKSCGACGCGSNVTVTWTIATDAGAYLDVVPLLSPFAVLDPLSPCVVACDPNDCVSPTFLRDPACPDPVYISPGDTAVNCFCAPLIRNETCTEFDVGDRHFLSEVEFEIFAGPTDLRNLEIRFWNKVGAATYDSGAYDACNSVASFNVSYVPGGATLRRTIYGVTIDAGAVTYDASGTIGGKSSGGGDACIRLEGGEYIVCAFTDPDNTAEEATITITAREYEP